MDKEHLKHLISMLQESHIESLQVRPVRKGKWMRCGRRESKAVRWFRYKGICDHFPAFEKSWESKKGCVCVCV